MKIVVDWASCDGNGNCVNTAPGLFALDEKGSLRVLKETVGNELRAEAEAAVRSCPKAALTLTE